MGGWVALGELVAVLGGLGAAWYFMGRGERTSAAKRDASVATGKDGGREGGDGPATG